MAANVAIEANDRVIGQLQGTLAITEQAQTHLDGQLEDLERHQTELFGRVKRLSVENRRLAFILVCLVMAVVVIIVLAKTLS